MLTRDELKQLHKFVQVPFIELQLFAKAEDEGRTEEASVYKQRKAREEGKVARSQEMVSAMVLLITFIIFWIFPNYFMELSKNLLTKTLSNLSTIPFNQGNAQAYLLNAVWDLLIVTAPILLATVVVAVLANVVQVGFTFSPKAIKADFKKISFTSNKMFSKIFFSRQTLANLIKSILKVGVVILIAYLILHWKQGEIVNTINMGVEEGFAAISQVSLYVASASCFVFLLLSIPDYFYQKVEHMESLKMTRHEVKEERKDTEGDPHIKMRLKERQRELLNRRMMLEVPKADVVITNPTHYAIAIKYDAETMYAPHVVAKGQDYMALKIKEIAKENDIHLIENKPLAQGLYFAVEVGDEIPEDFYQAVAEVLAFVIKAREALRG